MSAGSARSSPGSATWWAATHFIAISGAGRELTEGFGSLLAAAILLFVGVWMHGKAQAGAWQRYVRDKLDRALSRGSAWFLFASPSSPSIARCSRRSSSSRRLARQGNGAAMLAGVAVAVGAAGLIAWAMLRSVASCRSPSSSAIAPP